MSVELNQTISDLQEEMKLLKGEIKSVLKEIRTAVLSSDNPFTLDLGSGAVPPPDQPASPPPPADAGGPYFSVPASSDEPPPQEETPATPAPQAVAPVAPAAPPASVEATPPAAAEPGSDWSVLTVAGLMLWAEDAVATLGVERLRVVVELAAYAQLLPPGAREVLVRVAELAPNKEPEEKASVIDCVVVLHQLEAILHGDQGMRLPRRREGRLRRAA